MTNQRVRAEAFDESVRLYEERWHDYEFRTKNCQR